MSRPAVLMVGPLPEDITGPVDAEFNACGLWKADDRDAMAREGSEDKC